MDFPIHVAIGNRALLGPDTLPAAELGALIGANVTVANIDWTAPIAGRAGHDVLLSDAALVPIMGHALVRDFGAEDEPLIVFSHLLDDGAGEWDTLFLDLGRAVEVNGADPVFVLHGIALPGGQEPDIAPLAERLRGIGVKCRTGTIAVPQEDTIIDVALRRNLVIDRLVTRVPAAARGLALRVAEADLWAPVTSWLADCEKAGFPIDHRAQDDAIERLAARFVDLKLTAATGSR